MNRGGHSTLGGSQLTGSHHIVTPCHVADPRVDRNTTDQKIQEIVLWLLIWGEAGSLRHCPECLLYLFHSMSGEEREYQKKYGGGLLEDLGVSTGSSASGSVHLRPKRAVGDFLSMVVRPLYEVLKEENSKVGGRNYDDFNEFFWRTDCLNCQYHAASKRMQELYQRDCSPFTLLLACCACFESDYYADLKYRQDDRSSASASSSRMRGGGDVEDPPPFRSNVPVSQAIRGAKKSFLEKRSWIHPVRSFMRLISFYAVCFHLLVCIAYIHYLNIPLLSGAANDILASFVVSLAFWSLMREVVEFWAQYGIVSSFGSVWGGIGFLIRSGIKLAFLVLLASYYTWSRLNPDPAMAAEYGEAYFVVALIYLVPTSISILTQLFPRLSSRLLGAHLPFADELSKFWYPSQKDFVGHESGEPEGKVYGYQLFWALLLLWKMYASLLFQVSPLIQPTMDVLAHIDTLSLSIHRYEKWLNYAQIVVLWVPFILVYMFDTIIWYFLWQALVGLLGQLGVPWAQSQQSQRVGATLLSHAYAICASLCFLSSSSWHEHSFG
jgi:callose synthase